MLLTVAAVYLIERRQMDADERGQRPKESVPSKIKKSLRGRKDSATKRKRGEEEEIHELHAESAPRYELPTSANTPELGGGEIYRVELPAELPVELPAECSVEELEKQKGPVELPCTELVELPGDFPGDARATEKNKRVAKLSGKLSMKA